MVYYFHTATYIYAVTNGYCSQVFYADGEELSHSIVGAKLAGGLKALFDPDIVPLDSIEAGMYLKFETGGAALTTDAVKRIETVSSLSIPPAPRESSPEVLTIRNPIPTLPDILFPQKEEDDEVK